jgi:hypothetical protein
MLYATPETFAIAHAQACHANHPLSFDMFQNAKAIPEFEVDCGWPSLVCDLYNSCRRLYQRSAMRMDAISLPST